MDLNRLGRGSLGNAFGRIFGLDDLNAVSTLAPEILPTVSLAERPEFNAVMGDTPCWGGHGAAAVAGEKFFARLRNIAGTGALLVTESIHIYAAAGVEWVVQVQLNADLSFSTERVNQPVDTRRWGSGTVTNTSSAGIAGIVDGGTGPAPFLGTPNGHQGHGSAVITTPVILSPGFVCSVIGATANTAMKAAFYWRECRVPIELLNRL